MLTDHNRSSWTHCRTEPFTPAMPSLISLLSTLATVWPVRRKMILLIELCIARSTVLYEPAVLRWFNVGHTAPLPLHTMELWSRILGCGNFGYSWRTSRILVKVSFQFPTAVRSMCSSTAPARVLLTVGSPWQPGLWLLLTLRVFLQLVIFLACDNP